MHIYHLFLGLIGEPATHRLWGGGLAGGNSSRGCGEERSGVGVEGVALRAERGRLTAGLRMSVLASTEVDCLSFSLPCFLLAVTSSFRAVLDSLFPMILHRRCEI